MEIERKQYNLSDPSRWIDRLEKSTGKPLGRSTSTPINISVFLRKFSNEIIVKLNKELPQDAYIQKELTERKLG